MEIEIHVVHYLIISTVMMFCGIYGFLPVEICWLCLFRWN